MGEAYAFAGGGYVVEDVDDFRKRAGYWNWLVSRHLN